MSKDKSQMFIYLEHTALKKIMWYYCALEKSDRYYKKSKAKLENVIFPFLRP